jgi:hypothetical protein
VGLHVDAINRDSTQVYHDFFLGLWVAELFYTFALTPAKLAFLAFYWRIFNLSSIRLPIRIMVAVILCWSIVRASISNSSLCVQAPRLTNQKIVVTICHCIPVQGYWDKSIPAICNIDDQNFFVGSVIPHLVMDLIILALPAPYISKLKISLYQKFCVFAMFVFGGL